jgi:hypothetical protein
VEVQVFPEPSDEELEAILAALRGRSERSAWAEEALVEGVESELEEP